MASVINTNIPSLNSQRNLNASQTSLTTSLQRLSSGLRINSAKDDAAGLAISDRMSAQIAGMNQASRNANDGVSMAQTAEGALQSTGDILQRIRVLAVQSSSASNSASDRKALQTEVTQLTSELNRIAQTTSFNGQQLLDGTGGTSHFQVGANANELISMAGSNFTTNTYGTNQIAKDVPQAAKASVYKASTITINGSSGSAAIATTTATTSKSLAEAINQKSGDTGVTASAQTQAMLAFSNTAPSNVVLEVQGDNTTAVKLSFTTGATSSATDLAAGISAFNARSAETGITAEYDAKNKGIKLTHATGENISIKSTVATAGLTLANYKTDTTTAQNELVATPFTLATANAVGVANGHVTFDSNSSFSVADAGSGMAFSTGAAAPTSSDLKSVASLDISTFAGAQLAIKIADAAMATVNTKRAEFGAVQSRFTSAISNLAITSENLSSSRSRIVDTDFAAETATLTRGQILQQAGTAMLAQANSLPNGVLSLLRG